jgi:uncharacterized membrane protein
MSEPSPSTPTQATEPRIHTATAADASAWIAAGWEAFKRAPGPWMGILVVFFLVNLIAAFVPVVGSLAMTVLGPVFTFGWLLGARDLDAGRALTVGHLFAGFGDPARNSLILLGAVQLLASVGAALLAVAAIGGMAPGQLSVNPAALLVLLIVLAPLIAVFFFAAPLVGFARQPLGAALRLSFNATFRNWLALLIWGLLAFVLILLGALPFGLGLLVVAPLLAASYYHLYRTVFPDARFPYARFPDATP